MRLLCLISRLINKSEIKYDAVLHVKGVALDEASSKSQVLSQDKGASENETASQDEEASQNESVPQEKAASQDDSV